MTTIQNTTKHEKTNHSFNDSKLRWRVLPCSKLSTLLKGITSKHDGDFSLNCLHFFTTKEQT